MFRNILSWNVLGSSHFFSCLIHTEYLIKFIFFSLLRNFLLFLKLFYLLLEKLCHFLSLSFRNKRSHYIIFLSYNFSIFIQFHRYHIFILTLLFLILNFFLFFLFFLLNLMFILMRWFLLRLCLMTTILKIILNTLRYFLSNKRF